MHMPYIQQSHNNIYYFRLAMSTDLRKLVGRDYIRRTLKTRDPNAAFMSCGHCVAKERSAVVRFERFLVESRAAFTY